MPRYVVRCGSMRSLGVFTTPRGDAYLRGAKVVARTDRGQEIGEVLCEATDATLAQMQDPGRGQILRAMSTDDERELMRIRAATRAEFESCRRTIDELKLDMDLVDVEHLFGGERIVFYYLSENRVDFRELVKRLAAEFHTRIEMRQIGVRDEARLLADYGDCGKPVCCNTHLSQMPPVSMKMAKLQRATLDPSKISGRCGRLKCCLRYEYDVYVDLQKDLPRVGTTVLTRQGKFKVLGQEILAGQLLVETEDHRRIVIAAKDVVTVLQGGKKPPEEPIPGKTKREEAAEESGE
ncbi:MAG TPA: regulatory iron-sulfur-containing complex subunit RicT [Pirellulales bacterium]